MKVLISSAFVLCATAAIVSADSVIVHENSGSRRFPTHIVSVSPSETSVGLRTLRFRCQNNVTDANVSFEGSFGYTGEVRVTWADMAASEPLSAEGTATGDSAIIDPPIDFISRFVKEGRVAIEVEGYTAAGKGEYILSDPETRRGIYDLAKTCQWGGRLPALVEAEVLPEPEITPPVEQAPVTSFVAPSAGEPTADELRDALSGLQPEIDEYGIDHVRAVLEEMYSGPDAE